MASDVDHQIYMTIVLHYTSKFNQVAVYKIISRSENIIQST